MADECAGPLLHDGHRAAPCPRQPGAPRAARLLGGTGSCARPHQRLGGVADQGQDPRARAPRLNANPLGPPRAGQRREVEPHAAHRRGPDAIVCKPGPRQVAAHAPEPLAIPAIERRRRRAATSRGLGRSRSIDFPEYSAVVEVTRPA
jgi:hypothetical protein